MSQEESSGEEGEEAMSNNGNEPATKADIARLERVLEDKLEGMETRLLTEFQKWASPNEARQRRYSAQLREFEAQLEYMEDRIRKLEKRDN